MLNHIRTAANSIKNFSTGSYLIEHLKHRSLLRVSGTDASVFLQGLITNDIRHLNNSISSLFAMFLNNKGRVLFDTLIYRIEQNTYLVEVDREVSSLLQKHLSSFKVRKSVDILPCEKYSVWAIFDPNATLTKQEEENKGHESRFTTRIIDDHLLLVFKDPRLSLLGYRVLACVDSNDQVSTLCEKSCTAYKRHRFVHGVGEGVDELPPENCFPLEANCDYLHGISFHKGCYIGQELTARTHHTGVVRKRLMPVFTDSSEFEYSDGHSVQVNNVNVGKLRGFVPGVGLGLLRIAQVLQADTLMVGEHKFKTLRPTWWPVEAPKGKFTNRK